MSFNTLKESCGTTQVTIIDVYLDVNSTDESATATSYNTPKTTPGAVFDPDSTQLYRFSNQPLGPGAGPHFPILRNVSTSPPTINDGIGLRAGLTVGLDDIITNDTYELPESFADRRVTGSFIAKLLARNYLHNRPIILRRGFDPKNFNLDNFTNEHYIIDSISGPSVKGQLIINALDPLVWTSKQKARAPVKSVGNLAAGIDASQTTAIIIGTTKVGEYPTTGQIRIDDEICGYTITSDAVNNVAITITRGEWGSTAGAHDEFALCQLCFVANIENVTDIIQRLLVDFTSLDDSYIDLAQFADAKATSLSTHNYTGIITEPEGIGELIKSLLKLNNAKIYWNTATNLINLRHIDEFASPSYDLDALNDIYPDTLQTKFAEKEQITRQAISWARRDHTNDDVENFSRGFLFIDGLKEARRVYAEPNEKEQIKTVWLGTSLDQDGLAVSAAQLLVEKRANMPMEYNFSVDISHISGATGNGFFLGDFIRIKNAPLLTGPDLIPIDLDMQITQLSSTKPNVYNCTGLALTQTQADIDYAIQTDQEDLLLTDLAPPIAGRPTIVLIQSGVKIVATTIGNPALITGLYPDGLLIRNRGSIIARGGRGADANPDQLINAEPGGPALELQATTTIDNGGSGIIAGGGGGGGSTGIFGAGPGITYGGSGGGGGMSSNLYPSFGGLPTITQTSIPGGPGGQGDELAPGQGGRGNDTLTNLGGNGGQFGEIGLTGSLSGGKPPGAGGPAIVTNANVYQIIDGNNSFQIRGAII